MWWVEYARLAASILTPLTVLGIGYFLNRRLKSIDDAQWQNRKVVEKRLEIFDQLAPGLNQIFCFVMWVGYWKDVSPRDAVETKRDLDKTVNIYRHLLSEEFYDAYNEYIHSIFETFSGAGHNAKIRSTIESVDGDRRKHTNYEWEDEFDTWFSEDLTLTRQEVKKKYVAVMDALRDCIGL